MIHASAFFFLVLSGPGETASIRGDYLEARTCDVWTGPCFANAEVNETGREATLAWRVESGSWNGVDLSGLAVAAVVQASATLGDPFRAPEPVRSVLLLDASADPARRAALRSFALARLGELAGTVVEEKVVPVSLEVGGCSRKGCASLDAGEIAVVRTRCVGGDDHVCGNESVYYPPLLPVEGATPAVATEHAFSGEAIGTRWSAPGGRSAFTASFTASEDDPARNAGPRLEPLPEAEAKAPPEVPPAYAKLLDPKGYRCVGPDGKPLHEVWFRAEVPLAEKGESGLGVHFGRIPVGTFVGALRTFGTATDYRRQEIRPGVYALRYALQPEDGNHIGTAETRDFFVLTGFDKDKGPDAPLTAKAVEDASMLVSTANHPTMLYLVEPEGEGSGAEPRLRQRDGREEWVVEATLKTRVEGKGASDPLRIALVLIGSTDHP